MGSKHYAVVRFSFALLEGLVFPEGARIVRCWQCDRIPDVLEMMVEHPDFPEVREREMAIVIEPHYARIWDEPPATSVRTEFTGWAGLGLDPAEEAPKSIDEIVISREELLGAIDALWRQQA